MIINSYNEWDTLNEVVIGKGWMMDLNILETSFKLFYNSNINYEVDDLKKQVNKTFISEHIEDIEGLVTLLKSNNIKVYRPNNFDKSYQIKTPNWSTITHLTGPLNSRDLVAIFGDTIVEFPPEIRARYFETDMLKDIFLQGIKDNAKWITLPKSNMTNEVYDDKIIEPMLDAARCMRFNNNVIVNVNTLHNKLCVNILRNNFPHLTFHEVTWCDGHIDSCIAPLREGILLINKVFLPNPKEMLPDFCKNWDFIEVEFHEDYNADVYAGNDIMLASKNIDCNVLSINPNQIVCHDYSYSYLQPKLKQYNIECIPCQLRHSRIFDGAFHCLSLDLNRG